jgi:hypothetical protein
MMVQPMYEQAGDSREGLVRVYLAKPPALEGYQQFIDRTGRLIWDFEDNK